jgi:hypothetical protein
MHTLSLDLTKLYRQLDTVSGVARQIKFADYSTLLAERIRLPDQPVSELYRSMQYALNVHSSRVHTIPALQVFAPTGFLKYAQLVAGTAAAAETAAHLARPDETSGLDELSHDLDEVTAWPNLDSIEALVSDLALRISEIANRQQQHDAQQSQIAFRYFVASILLTILMFLIQLLITDD